MDTQTDKRRRQRGNGDKMNFLIIIRIAVMLKLLHFLVNRQEDLSNYVSWLKCLIKMRCLRRMYKRKKLKSIETCFSKPYLIRYIIFFLIYLLSALFTCTFLKFCRHTVFLINKILKNDKIKKIIKINSAYIIKPNDIGFLQTHNLVFIMLFGLWS